jgi:ribosomal protein L11
VQADSRTCYRLRTIKQLLEVAHAEVASPEITAAEITAAVVPAIGSAVSRGITVGKDGVGCERLSE